MVWIAPIFWLIGGGNFMPPALLYLMASEHVDENQRLAFFYLISHRIKSLCNDKLITQTGAVYTIYCIVFT